MRGLLAFALRWAISYCFLLSLYVAYLQVHVWIAAGRLTISVRELLAAFVVITLDNDYVRVFQFTAIAAFLMAVAWGWINRRRHGPART